MKKQILLMAVVLTSLATFAQNSNELLDKYYEVKNALVDGDAKRATEATSSLLNNLKNEDAFNQKEALVKATEKLVKAGDLEKQRAAFSTVSELMWLWVQKNKDIQKDVYYDYCPMKKAYWLSAEPAIRNPYYGSKMLTCGSIKDKKTL